MHYPRWSPHIQFRYGNTKDIEKKQSQMALNIEKVTLGDLAIPNSTNKCYKPKMSINRPRLSIYVTKLKQTWKTSKWSKKLNILKVSKNQEFIVLYILTRTEVPRASEDFQGQFRGPSDGSPGHWKLTKLYERHKNIEHYIQINMFDIFFSFGGSWSLFVFFLPKTTMGH